jgi:hypothetical protein
VYLELGTGHRIPTFWPPGYRAVFTPILVVFDPSGREVARGGVDLEEQFHTGITPCYSTEGVYMLPA